MQCKTHSSDSLGNSYAFYRASAVLRPNRDREIGTVIAESKNKLIIVDDEIKKEHVYLIPKTKVDHYGKSRLYFNITQDSLKKFEM